MKIMEIKDKLESVFDKNQSDILAEIIYDSSFIKTSDFNELKTIVKELAEASKASEHRLTRVEKAIEQSEHRLTRVEKAIEELTLTQKEGFKALRDQIAALGSRWGIYSEVTFRSTIRRILSAQKGVEVKSGYYGGREVDLIISNGEHIILEITSRMKSSDIKRITLSGDDYKKTHNIEPVLMVATSYISPNLMQKIVNLPQKIEIFSYEGEEEE
jgi:hypothetical protein